MPPEITHQPESNLFLQGSTDLGGGCLYAGWLAAYVSAGMLACFYLTWRLAATPGDWSFSRRLRFALSELWLPILLFCLIGPINISYDALIAPNDHRNVFILAALIYLLSLLLIVSLRGLNGAMRLRYAVAPLFLCLWIFLGWNGTTARAGQLLNAGENPTPIVRSWRHDLMLRWHHLCDRTLAN